MAKTLTPTAPDIDIGIAEKDRKKIADGLSRLQRASRSARAAGHLFALLGRAGAHRSPVL